MKPHIPPCGGAAWRDPHPGVRPAPGTRRMSDWTAGGAAHPAGRERRATVAGGGGGSDGDTVSGDMGRRRGVPVAAAGHSSDVATSDNQERQLGFDPPDYDQSDFDPPHFDSADFGPPAGSLLRRSFQDALAAYRPQEAYNPLEEYSPLEAGSGERAPRGEAQQGDICGAQNSRGVPKGKPERAKGGSQEGDEGFSEFLALLDEPPGWITADQTEGHSSGEFFPPKLLYG